MFVKTNFRKLPDGEKRVQVKRGINFFCEFFRAIPDDYIREMSEENKNRIIEFLKESLERVERTKQ